MPKNIDDRNLYPTMSEYTVQSVGFTDMTFMILRCEVTDIMRTMADSRRYCLDGGRSFASMTLQEKDAWVQSCEHDLHQRYSRHCSPSVPIQWVCVESFLGLNLDRD